MFYEQRLIGMMANFGYLIGDPEAKVAAVVDPSFDARVLQKVASENGYAIELILNTHHHPDHVFDNKRLADETSAKVAAHRLSQVRKDIVLEDGAIVPVGGLKVKVVHTPGHSPDSCCFIVAGRVFTGHHYGPTPTSTIGHEKETNYTLQPRSLEEFKAFMRAP